MTEKNQRYVIGVDGGGTKTVAALANLDGKILKLAKSGPSNLRNIKMGKAVENVAEAIEKVLIKGEILSTFIGLAAIQEEYWQKREEIKKELLSYKEISPVFKGKIIINSDQIAAFRSGTNEKDGVVLISGTGCVAHGWRGKKELKTSGWGNLLNDEGSAFWVGQKAFQAIWKDLDGRGPKTLLTKLVFQWLKIKKKEDLLTLVYSKTPTEIIPRSSIFCDKAARKGDKIAKNIMTEAGKELSLSANQVIRRLGFPKTKFPLVLIGSLFKSKIVLNTVKREIKKFAPKTQFIRPKQEPVVGAIKLALGQIK